jgi:subtilisin family serine protease
VLLFIQTGYSQKLFIYGGKGEKIYLQEIDSLIQIKFRKDASLNEQLKIVKSVDPETKFLESKSNHLIISLKKGILSNFVNLNKESSVIYANKSLISADGIVQFPTEKVLVKVKASIQMEEILHSLYIDYESISRLGSDKNSFLIKLKNGESIRIANQLYESGYFEYAQPSFTRLIKMQNEFYPNQWGLNNTGQNGGTSGIDINAPEAWAMTRGCNNIRVAVIDQGVDLDHPDLAGNLLPGFDATDGGDGGINGDCWGDDAHGTCCAGIIGAVNNTIGTIGVAHNCRIIPIRVTYTRNGNEIWDDDWVVSAINHAWEVDGADILSCSWRYQNVVAINTEINNALTSGRNTLGCVIVFASGNNNSTISYPANSNPDIIAVGAMSPCGQRKRSSSNIWEVNAGVSTDPQGVSCDNEKWWGSNYGNELDIVAPGVFVPTTDIQGLAGYNTASGTGGNYHQTFNGTSSATPHVAGVAALILSMNPGLTQDQVRDIIESTCTKVGNYSYSTVAGRSNGNWNSEVG